MNTKELINILLELDPEGNKEVQTFDYNGDSYSIETVVNARDPQKCCEKDDRVVLLY